MPDITLRISKLPTETKKELIEKLTATASEVTKIPPNLFTILIDEFPEDNIGVGGKTLTDFKKGM